MRPRELGSETLVSLIRVALKVSHDAYAMTHHSRKHKLLVEGIECLTLVLL